MRQIDALRRQASTPKTSHATADVRPHATSALASRPLATMPAPGPTNIAPPSSARPRSASCVRHQPEPNTNTIALATPARKRSPGQATGSGNAIASVSTPVAARPARTSAGPSIGPAPGRRTQSSGTKVHSSAPLR